MNSILSIVMVIVMAFSSIGGVTAALKEPVSFDAKINVDADGILALAGTAATEETKQTITIVKDIVGALTLKGVADKDNAELDVRTDCRFIPAGQPGHLCIRGNRTGSPAADAGIHDRGFRRNGRPGEPGQGADRQRLCRNR